MTALPYRDRRSELCRSVETPILLMGNGVRASNLPMNHVRFRQDSTFLYFLGCTVPGAAATIVDGRTTLYLPRPPAGDELWHGAPAHPWEQLADHYDVDRVADIGELHAGPQYCSLAVADTESTAKASKLTGTRLEFGVHYGDDRLVNAVIHQRTQKSESELAELRKVADLSSFAHSEVIARTHPGSHERSLTAWFEAILSSRGCATAYDTILTQSGEVLHNFKHDAELESGRMVLLDGGAELPSAYAADISRTWPVSGTFSPRQRAVYDAVLTAQLAAIEQCTVGTSFRRVHDTACRVLTQFLVEERLLTGDVDSLVERGAHALFFPHGVGHHIGMDVHDLENFGDRPSYPPGVERPAPFGTRYLRLNRPLQEGWVVTVEPGFYVVPAILADTELREEFRDCADFESAEEWVGFGGIRIEDDVAISLAGPEVLTAAAPKAPDAIEALVGTKPPPEAHLWS